MKIFTCRNLLSKRQFRIFRAITGCILSTCPVPINFLFKITWNFNPHTVQLLHCKYKQKLPPAYATVNLSSLSHLFSFTLQTRDFFFLALSNNCPILCFPQLLSAYHYYYQSKQKKNFLCLILSSKIV